MADPGILAIWNDVRTGDEAEFEAWFQGEHLVERLAVTGFLFGRRHQATSRYRWRKNCAAATRRSKVP
jgi:hypothetical protein